MESNLFDLAARVSIDNSGVDAALASTQKGALSLAKEFEATELVAKKSALGMATSMAAVNAEIGKMKLANLTGDYDKFSNALKNNSVSSRLAADAFLNLFPKISSHSQVAAEAEKGTNKLAEAFRILSSSAVVVDGPLGGVAGRLRAIGTDAGAAGGLLGPGGLIALGLVGIGVGAVAAGIAIFEMASKAAEAGKQILEISQKTNLSTESISAFRVAAELSGTSIDRVGNKLAGFNVVLGQAQSGNKAMAKIFTDMGVDIKQTSEGALTQFLKKFDEMGPTAQRNALEAKLFRDRTGELIPLLIQMGGSLDEAKKQAYDLGLSFDNVSARSAKEFDDKLKLIKLGSEGLATQIGMKDIPAIEAAMNDLSKALGVQENSWRAWGEYIGNVLSGAVINTGSAVAAINQFLANIKTGTSGIYNQTKEFIGSAIGTAGGVPGSSGVLWSNLKSDPYAAIYATQTPGQAFDAEQKRLTNQIANYKPPAASPTPGYSGGGGGGGKGKKGGKGGGGSELELEKENLKGLEQMFKAEQESYDRSLKMRETSLADFVAKSEELEMARHAATEPILLQELTTAEKVKDAGKRKLDVQKALNALAAEHYKVAKTIEVDEDKLIAQREQLDRIAAEARLSVRDKSDAGEKAAIQYLASFQLLTAEQTAAQLGVIDEAALMRKRKDLEVQLVDAKNDAVKHAEIQKQLDDMLLEGSNLHEQVFRNISIGRDKDLTEQRAYTDKIRGMNASVETSLLDAARTRIDAMAQFGSITPGQQAGAIKLIDVQGENARFDEVKAALASNVAGLQQTLDATMKATSANDWLPNGAAAVDKIRAQMKALGAQLEADETVHQAKMLQIQLASLAQLKAAMDQGFSLIMSGIDEISSKGWKAAFLDTLLGFAKMLRDMEIQLLESKLLASIQGMATGSGSSGGGFLGWVLKILGIAGGAVAGGVGGGAGGGVSGSTSVHFLAGGIDRVPYDNFPAILHKDERVMTAAQNQAGGGQTHIHYWNITTQDARSFQSQDTERQITQRANRIMQRAALTG
jgi:hypothetical protein